MLPALYHTSGGYRPFQGQRVCAGKQWSFMALINPTWSLDVKTSADLNNLRIFNKIVNKKKISVRVTTNL